MTKRSNHLISSLKALFVEEPRLHQVCSKGEKEYAGGTDYQKKLNGHTHTHTQNLRSRPNGCMDLLNNIDFQQKFEEEKKKKI